MGFKDSIAFIKKLWILLFLFLLVVPNQLTAQPATLKLDRLWALDIQGSVTALRLADFDGNGRNEILVGVWEGDSGYIQVFEGHDGMLCGTSESIHKPDHEIIDMDVGDIDGDRYLELVGGVPCIIDDIYDPYYNKSFILVFSAATLNIEWQEQIQGRVKSIEAHDINMDDTVEVFVGTAYHVYRCDAGMNSWTCQDYWNGMLYYLNGKDGTLTKMFDDSHYYTPHWPGFWRLLADDVDEDSCSEILCGTASGYGFWEEPFAGNGGGGYLIKEAHIEVIDHDTSLHTIAQLFLSSPSWELHESGPSIRGLSIGNCDLDEAQEIVSLADCGEKDHFDLILSVNNASNGYVEYRSYYNDALIDLAILDVNNEPPDEILIVNSNGMITAINGTSFDTIAISDPLPAISFFAFGDINGDALPEVCISDGDSLFVYTTPVTGVGEEDEGNLASKFVLHQNYPNPFNAQTTIKYYLSQGTDVQLAIYNIMGQEVKTLVNDFQLAGSQNIAWDGTDKNDSRVASGVYFYRVKTDYSEETKKMVLLK